MLVTVKTPYNVDDGHTLYEDKRSHQYSCVGFFLRLKREVEEENNWAGEHR